MSISRETEKGFSLIETAIMIVVVGLLFTAGASFYSIYKNYHDMQETAEEMAMIQKALQAYSSRHGHLPCPAPSNEPLDSEKFGQPVSTTNCSGTHDGTQYDSTRGVLIGSLPVRALNLPDTAIIDSWGNRFIYAVTSSFAQPGADLNNGEGAISIKDAQENAVTSAPDNAIYTLLSTGNDRRGAYNLNGQQSEACDVSSVSGKNCDGDGEFTSTLVTNDADMSNMYTSMVTYQSNIAHYEWDTGAWQLCSGVCNEGIQKRDVLCKDHRGRTVPETRCGGVKPLDQQPCTLANCLWDEGVWGSCSNNCGAGTQARDVFCMRPDSNIKVDDDLCTSTLKPATSMGCVSETGCSYVWKTGEWGTCSAECNGKKSRTVQCIKEQTGEVVADGKCSSQKPAVQINCEDASSCKVEIPTTDPPPPGQEEPPSQFCFFHVSGLLIAHEYVPNWFTVIGRTDPWSNLVGPGSYAQSQPFAKANAATFDGIAIGRDTRVVIYSRPNFQGNIILDQQGPAVINNLIWRNRAEAQNGWATSTWPGTFHGQFPPSVRRWSNVDMHAWGHGTSLKVTCD